MCSSCMQVELSKYKSDQIQQQEACMAEEDQHKEKEEARKEKKEEHKATQWISEQKCSTCQGVFSRAHTQKKA